MIDNITISVQPLARSQGHVISKSITLQGPRYPPSTVLLLLGVALGVPLAAVLTIKLTRWRKNNRKKRFCQLLKNIYMLKINFRKMIKDDFLQRERDPEKARQPALLTAAELRPRAQAQIAEGE